MASNAEDTNQNSNNITTHEFLEFLKLTCQVNDSIGSLNVDPTDNIDYNSLANNDMINSLLASQNKDIDSSLVVSSNDQKVVEKKEKNGRKKSLTSSDSKLRRYKTEAVDDKSTIHPVLSEKLDEIINEGILDSVLPFIFPSASSATLVNPNNVTTKASKIFKVRDLSPCTSTRPSTSRQDSDKKDSPSENQIQKSPRVSEQVPLKAKESKMLSRRSIGHLHVPSDDKKMITEVVIHVCDEVKNTSKDFSCPQHLLVSKMGYFADVTAGQRLEDMDISVHCDLQIFDWLMKWVKKDTLPQESCPTLDANNVVPILVSASFLQMEPLLLDCLSFCHSRLNEVVRASTNLSCLNDSIITRLAAMFTNLELEMIKDKKERITPRLWTKMIQSLCEPEPQALRGHYFSLGGLFRCNRCGKYLTQSVSSYISCVPGNMRLNRWGQLISQHSRDTSWQMTNYVALLFKELKSWRKVYWKLWGHCHFLYCCICEAHFPTYQMNWCQFHPEAPQFLGPITEGRIAGPAGRYPCCGQQAFRFESLPGPNGCQFREHSVLIETDRDRAILTLAQIAAEGNCLYEPQPAKPQAHANNEPRWAGISLMPTKCRQGLLPPLHIDDFHCKMGRKIRQNTCFLDSSSDSDTSDNTDRKCVRKQISTSSDGCESESSSPRLYRSKNQRRKVPLFRFIQFLNEIYFRRNRATGGRYWSGEMSARSNQDNQREFEERVMKQVVAMVCKKTGSDSTVNYHNYHNGGSYVRLEAEWKEHVRQKNLNKPKMK